MIYFKKVLFIVFVLICCFATNAQQGSKSFLVKISDERYIPKLDSNSNRYLVEASLTDAKDLNNLLWLLNIDNLVYVNDIDVNETEKLIFFSVLLDDYDLTISTLGTLINNYVYFLDYEEIMVYDSLTTPYYPVDYENADSYQIYSQSQNDLNVIRAPEAWGITQGDPNVLIGIADTGFWAGHPDLDGEIIGGVGNYDTGPLNSSSSDSSKHGSAVAGYASAATDNEIGSISSIGFNTKMLVARGLSVYNLKLLSDMGAKVVNASFGSPVVTVSPTNTDAVRINEIVNNGTVVVAAAGNGPVSGGTSNTNGILTNESYSSRYYTPASYKNVISVSTVGNLNEIGSSSIAYDNWKDVHLIAKSTAYPNNNPNYSGTNQNISDSEISWQHNDSVDIVVPSYFGSPKIFPQNNIAPSPIDFYRNSGPGGTSYSAPIVGGTVGLMFSVNYCLDPKEIETILKLTAVKIDTIPENLPFYGRLGAGRLDSYEAVKMSKDMAELMGTVEVKNRILYRPWFYKLATAPFEIKMINNEVSSYSKLKFRARNNIEIISGSYLPNSGGYIDLQINSNLQLTDCDAPVNYSDYQKPTTVEKVIDDFNRNEIKITPTLVVDKLNFEDLSIAKENIFNTINIYDVFGVKVFEIKNNKLSKLTVDLSHLNSGIYIVHVLDDIQTVIQVKKIVKK